MAGIAIARILYHIFRKPYYPSGTMVSESFSPLMEMTERQLIVGSLIKDLKGKRILDIGSGYLPLYKYMPDGVYQMLTCVDPILKTEELGFKIKCLGIGIEEMEYRGEYDTIVLLGLSHMMGKKAFEAIDKILINPNTKNFILEYAVSVILPIYVKRITGRLPKLAYKKKLSIYLEYPRNLLGNRRHMEVWTR